jgi:hypothetical protein
MLSPPVAVHFWCCLPASPTLMINQYQPMQAGEFGGDNRAGINATLHSSVGQPHALPGVLIVAFMFLPHGS